MSRAVARELLDRHNALTERYVALVNQSIDQCIDEDRPLDDAAIENWESQLAELTADFERLDRDVDAALAGGSGPALATA